MQAENGEWVMVACAEETFEGLGHGYFLDRLCLFDEARITLPRLQLIPTSAQMRRGGMKL
jgi:hypothetical protein